MEQNSKITTPKPTSLGFAKSGSIKLLIIGAIALVLLIPQSFTLDLIEERQLRMIEAEEDIRGKWSREQTLTGPYLKVPYFELKEIVEKGEKKIIKEQRNKYFLPETLNLRGNIDAQLLHRGIFDVVVYTNDIAFDAKFDSMDLQKMNILPENILWNQAELLIGISDLRGISGSPTFKQNSNSLVMEPFAENNSETKGLLSKITLDPGNSSFSFTGNMVLKGSKDFSIVPLGKTTHLDLSGNWSSPSFQGEFLPDSRSITADGFQSNWQVLHFNRPFGQVFDGYLPNLSTSAFGLSLVNPVDQYQQSTRTSKYAILIIALSFLALFLMELFTKSPIHPVQYTLIGFALVLYYTLLIALSEHLGFTFAYGIASLATVTLLGLYSRSIFPTWKETGLFGSVLSIFYLFIFIIVKQQDFALLIGSIGLFISLAVTMFVSRKINFSQQEIPSLHPSQL
ncbi:cell envelope integrity protein CreD [Algoriphagus litoralis]|uniref:cell envelope integrity protein CreD n=1 Tax=Algoriphagus litoralis TaxID=2202829 RepID=UPI000DB9242D|nr:cell envelope integrity protein CreD [Algoriphagus litoralis]